MSKDRMTLGYRYIELFPASHEELEEMALRGQKLSPTLSFVICGHSSGCHFSVSVYSLLEMFFFFLM